MHVIYIFVRQINNALISKILADVISCFRIFFGLWVAPHDMQYINSEANSGDGSHRNIFPSSSTPPDLTLLTRADHDLVLSGYPTFGDSGLMARVLRWAGKRDRGHHDCEKLWEGQPDEEGV
jgi:hypothetical protein